MAFLEKREGLVPVYVFIFPGIFLPKYARIFRRVFVFRFLGIGGH